MKSYHLDTFGSIEGITLHEHDIPKPGKNEVLIKVYATSLNKRDIYILNKTYPLPPRQGVIVLSDGAGEVIEAGQNVTRFKTGDRVAGNYFARWRDGQVDMRVGDQLGCTLDGMLSEYVVLHEDWLVHIPPHLSWNEAATLPCAALTAWSALTGSQPLLPGDTVLTIGSGGVPLFVIQFARLLGLNVISLTSKDEKKEKLKQLGATHAINYSKNDDWHIQVRELTGGNGVERVVETGGISTFEKSVKATAFGGEVILLNSVGRVNDKDTGIIPLLRSAFVGLVTIKPLYVGSRKSFESMNRAIVNSILRPVIEKVFSFNDTKEAYRYFDKGEHFGKIVIELVTAGS